MKSFVRSLRFSNGRFFCERISIVPTMIENTLLITLFSINASSLICWKTSNAVSMNCEEKRDDLDCASLLLISAQLLGFCARLFLYMSWSLRCCSKPRLYAELFLVVKNVSDSFSILTRFLKSDWLKFIVELEETDASKFEYWVLSEELSEKNCIELTSRMSPRLDSPCLAKRFSFVKSMFFLSVRWGDTETAGQIVLRSNFRRARWVSHCRERLSQKKLSVWCRWWSSSFCLLAMNCDDKLVSDFASLNCRFRLWS